MGFRELSSRVKSCHRCEALGVHLVKGPIFYRGKNYLNVLMVGESPHRSWIDQGDPFDSESGKRLEEYLGILGLGIEDIALIECTKCYVSERKNLNKMMANCSDILRDQIAELKPRMIISFGVASTRQIGLLFKTDLKPTSLIKSGDFELLSLYHPSPINPHNHCNNLKFLKSSKTKKLLPIL